MKRKVVTVTEYYGGLAGPRSVLQRLVDVFSPPRHDFYPPEQKRHFYPDGVTLKSIAFADGTLYGGYDQTNEPIVPALLHRMSSTIYKAVMGVELKVYSMGVPRFDNAFLLDLTVVLSWVFPAMLGFLGTVQGMIVAFHNIVEMDKTGGGNIIQAAASGIEVALLTTCFGLIVGIPAFMAFNYFSSVINSFVLEVEESAAELMEAVTLQLTLNQADREGRE